MKLEELRLEAEQINGFRNQSYNNCGFLNSCVSEFLADNGIEHHFVRQDGKIEYRGDRYLHEYIVIEAGEVIDERLIVDASFEQLNESRLNSGDVPFSFGKKSALPDVLIISPSTDYSQPSVGVDPGELFSSFNTP